MSLSLSHKVQDIFGGEIEPLNGHHIIVAAEFAVLGKLPTPEELVKMEERRAKRRSGAEVEKGGPRTPKTYAVQGHNL